MAWVGWIIVLAIVSLVVVFSAVGSGNLGAANLRTVAVAGVIAGGTVIGLVMARGSTVMAIVDACLIRASRFSGQAWIEAPINGHAHRRWQYRLDLQS